MEEDNLAQSVSMPRKALGERAGSRQFIETIPRSGSDVDREAEAKEQSRFPEH